MILWNNIPDNIINSCQPIVLQIAKDNGFEVKELFYNGLDDNELHKMNVDFLQHDTLTDIITFDYNRRNRVLGEIYISLDRVFENAKNSNNLYEDELCRVIFHGALHLVGFKDKSLDEKKLMRQKEDYYLSLRA